MTKWIVSTPLKGTDLMKNFVCFGEAELRKLLEQYPDATVEMKGSHLEDYPEMKDCSLISTAQTENYIQVKDVYYSLDEFNHIGDYLLGQNLTDDQQVVLESLKHYYGKPNFYAFREGKEPMKAVDRMLMEAESGTTGLSDVYYRLTEKQQFQVLAAFAEWGSKEANQ